MRTRSITLLVTALVTGVSTALLAPLTAAQAAPNPSATYAWLQVKSGSTPTGHIDITVHALDSRPWIAQCVYDDASGAPNRGQPVLAVRDVRHRVLRHGGAGS